MNYISNTIYKIIKYITLFIIIIKNKKSSKLLIINRDCLLKEKSENIDNIDIIFTDRAKKSNKIDISIVIPIFNGELFINKSIDSVLMNKTNYSFELILVNDGSTDNSEHIIIEYEKKYPNIIRAYSKENGGLSSARNYGMKYANGKYISFLDCDDYISEDYIERMLSVAYKEDADIVKCGTRTVSFNTNKTLSIDVKPKEIINGPMKEKILNYSSYAWGAVFKSSLFNNVQFPEGYWYEDMIIRFLIFRKSNKFVNLNEIHHFRTMHDNQLTKQFKKDKTNRCLEHLYLIETLVDENDKFGLPRDVYMYLNVLHECSSIMVSRMENLEDDIKKQVFLRVYDLVNGLYKEEYEKELKGKYKLTNDIILKKRYDLWLMLKYL